MRDLPSGTVTFLFTDIEGSTGLLHELGAETYAGALAEHRRILRHTFARHGGVEVDTQGDAFFVAFPTAPGAITAARAGQESLAAGPIRVRIGIHTGAPHLGDEGYVGPDVHRAARIAAAGHGGQVLVSAATAALVGSSADEMALRDLGLHRLKDLSARERIFQLGDGDFPPLKTLYQTNLPVPLTPFLGRGRELAEVIERVSRTDVRLVTLTGPGGTGKTRLAAQAAAEMGDRYPGGVWWVPLAPLRDPALVLETASRVLGAKDGLAEHIADRSILLLFDNFEQVVEAASDVAGLLGSCPNLELLVTSREPLHVIGEHEYPVPPLAPPEGVDLFLSRAQAVKPDFEADRSVAEICRRLDDLPLAIELAAARVKALSSAQILARLDQRLPLLTGGARDLPERQRTLRAAIGWSYELLTAEEQRAFARLAVFRAGCTLEAAESVADADIDTLQSLVDKSLLRHRDERFVMLETIREYSAGQLDESAEAEDIRRRHAEHFLALAEEVEPQLRGGRPREALELLDREHDNVRAALDGLEALGEAELAQRLAGAVSRFWYLRGHLAEGKRRLESALSLDARPTAARAKALTGASVMAFNLGDTSAARRFTNDALALYRDLGDQWGVAYSVMMLGNVSAEEGDWATGRDLYAESLRRFTEIGDPDLMGIAADNLGWAYVNLGDLAKARPLYEENLRQARALDDRRLEAMALGSLARLARDEGRIEDARSMLKGSVRVWHELGNRQMLARDLGSLARATAMAGRAEVAARLVARSAALFEEIGAVEVGRVEFDDGTLSLIRGVLDDATVARALDDGRALTVDEAVALALDS